jgi:hypothetical protein
MFSMIGILAAGFPVAVVARWLGFSGVTTAMFLVCSVVQLHGYALALAGYLLLNDMGSACTVAISIPQTIFKLVVLICFPARFVDAFLLGSFSFTLIEGVLVNAAVVGMDYAESVRVTFMSASVVNIVLFVLFRFARGYTIRRARRLVLHDRAQYDRIWGSVLAANATALIEVAREASQLSTACAPHTVRQTVLAEVDRDNLPGGASAAWSGSREVPPRAQAGAPWSALFRSSSSFCIGLPANGGQPVTSLDQLYVQVNLIPLLLLYSFLLLFLLLFPLLYWQFIP